MLKISLLYFFQNRFFHIAICAHHRRFYLISIFKSSRMTLYEFQIRLTKAQLYTNCKRDNLLRIGFLGKILCMIKCYNLSIQSRVDFDITWEKSFLLDYLSFLIVKV